MVNKEYKSAYMRGYFAGRKFERGGGVKGMNKETKDIYSVTLGQLLMCVAIGAFVGGVFYSLAQIIK